MRCTMWGLVVEPGHPNVSRSTCDTACSTYWAFPSDAEGLRRRRVSSRIECRTEAEQEPLVDLRVTERARRVPEDARGAAVGVLRDGDGSERPEAEDGGYCDVDSDLHVA